MEADLEGEITEMSAKATSLNPLKEVLEVAGETAVMEHRLMEEEAIMEEVLVLVLGGKFALLC